MKQLKVLSLFDGMSCGQIALERSGIQINKYYASEIEESAIKITMANYPDTVQIGNVNKIDPQLFKDIDLLIGGSPCQGFSIAGKRMQFADERSKLLLKFVEFKNAIQPKHFLLENVAMAKQCSDFVSEILGVPFVKINSKSFSAQDRKRLYWTNLEIPSYIENPAVVKDILESDADGLYNANCTAPLIRLDGSRRKIGYFGKDSQANRVYSIEHKGVCLCGEAGGGGGKTGFYEVADRIRKLTPMEAERMQTVPDGYTDKGLSDNQRYKALGNGWTVDVVAHILKNIYN